jgi:hypothetical protein
MSRIKAGLELAQELKEEEQLEEIQTEPTEETVEEFQVESLEDTVAEIEESFDLAVEGLWSDFKRDFLGKEPRGGTAAETFRQLAQKYARKSAEAKDAHDMDSALKYRDLSWYYSLMSGKPPSHIKDADQFKYDIEQKYSNEIKSNLNELKEPATDDTDIDNDDYLKNLTRKKVKKDYAKSLPKGHTNLAKKYKLKEADDVSNPKDTVTLDIPLLIRLLEYAREDANSDMDLHDLTEKMVSMGSEGGKTLSMSDYDQLVARDETQSHTEEPAMEAKKPAMNRAKLLAKMEKNAPSFKKAMQGKEEEPKK